MRLNGPVSPFWNAIEEIEQLLPYPPLSGYALVGLISEAEGLMETEGGNSIALQHVLEAEDALETFIDSVEYHNYDGEDLRWVLDDLKQSYNNLVDTLKRRVEYE
jgi:hypothetical protein